MGSNTGDEEEGESRENSKEETYWKRMSSQNISGFLEGVKWVNIFKVLLIIQVSLLDPLFFYIPVINGRQKCVRLDKKLGAVVMVFRSLMDSFYVIYIIVELHKHFLVVRRTGKYQYTRLGKFFLIDFLAVLPLPQVVTLIIPTMRGSRFLNAMYLLRSVVLCQFVPRSFRAYLFITSGTFGGPVKARVKFSPLIFLLGIDVIGAFWYFLSIERLVQCWTKACETQVGCVNSFYCKGNIDHTSLEHFCPIDGQKTDFFDFGIFNAALQHRVLEMTYFPKKFLYCFQWSLQNLSGFGQNLQTSTYIWENLLAISMSILGLLLFFLLLGNVQAFFESQRKNEIEKNRLEAVENIEKWPPLEKLSVDLKQDIKKYLKYYWEKNITDAGMILLELPIDLKRSIERALGLELLKKVKAFEGIGQNELDDLSRYIKLKIFDEGEYIVEEEKIINNMVFIMHGKLKAHSSLGDSHTIDYGHLHGEEVTWGVFNYLRSSKLWGSSVTIEALTRVHALVLPADKVRDFVNYVNYLPDINKRSVRHELSFDFFKKIKAFKHIGQNELDDLSKYIELKIFDKDEYIVEEGKTINDMVFIFHGKLEARSSLRETHIINVLKDGDIYGEEVTLDMIFNDQWPSSELWKSTVTVKSLTRIHALVLTTNRVRDFLHPEDLKKSARHELCFDFFKKVKAFEGIYQNALDDLSNYVKLKIFDEGEYIVEEGKISNNMVFIMHGKLKAHSSLRDSQTIDVLKDGHLYGEEVTWSVFNYKQSSKLWGSTVTIEALMRVHALVLSVNKVRDFVKCLPNINKRSVRHELSFDFFKKVKAFKDIGQNKLDDLSECIELEIFDEREYIMEEGKRINDMVFILHGKLEVRSSLRETHTIDVLKDGDICGEEVTLGVFNYQWSYKLWGSTVTIKALTRVHALVLPADQVRDFLRFLPDDLQRSMRRELSFVFLKKVKAFKHMGENDFDDLYESIELKSFDEGEYIVEEGKTINEIVLIVHGKLGPSSSLVEFNPINALKDCDIYGEEVIWEVIFHDQWPSYELWGSTVTIKALTRVHALVLPTDQVRYFFRCLPDDLQRSIRRELYFVFSKKVKAFEHIGQNELDHLFGSIELKLFDEGEYIVEEGKIVNDIVFIVHGRLEAHNSLKDYLLIDGDICGEEVTWNCFRGDWSFDHLPLSTVTIKAVTRVYALVLPVQRVRDFILFGFPTTSKGAYTP